ncbi:tyrosine-type recombinase/integrase [Micromonospora thermarum]|uniref:tyrosine-type recombinase/integrase n=1 Tax=Micromonospora thermarum TaxID=2720024 RepID=UPI00197B7B9C|nr:tyrosine-type recombinase/integrase [Micromonospora thermarum]
MVPLVRLHLEQYAGKDRLFVSRDGTPLWGNTLYQAFVRARKKVGLDDLTFHDLRHTGQTLAAQTGATLADLMQRLGHSSMAAARRHLHAVDGRDREIASLSETRRGR